MRSLLLLSLIANVILGVCYAELQANHANLLTWACEHGNGGHDCGEM